jgi:hypothetical protein
MNPHDELERLISLFPQPEPLYLVAEHVPASQTPDPYKTMLVHDAHMTLAMERHFGSPVNVQVLRTAHQRGLYCREITLKPNGRDQVVQYGLVRFDLEFVTPAVQAEIVRGELPLGRILINHNVLRHIDLGAIVKFSMGPGFARIFGQQLGTITYGRLATIFCNGKAAVDLLEVTTPL